MERRYEAGAIQEIVERIKGKYERHDDGEREGGVARLRDDPTEVVGGLPAAAPRCPSQYLDPNRRRDERRE